MKRVVISALLILFVVLGCGPNIKEGTILDHRYTPAHTDMYWNSYKNSYSCGTTKSPRTCYSGGWDYIYYSDRWELFIKDCHEDKPDCTQAWVSVTNQTYANYPVGSYIKFS